MDTDHTSSSTDTSECTAVLQRKRCTGRSRTTQWRKRKRVAPSSSESCDEQEVTSPNEEENSSLGEVWVDTLSCECLLPESTISNQLEFFSMDKDAIPDEVHAMDKSQSQSLLNEEIGNASHLENLETATQVENEECHLLLPPTMHDACLVTSTPTAPALTRGKDRHYEESLRETDSTTVDSETEDVSSSLPASEYYPSSDSYESDESVEYSSDLECFEAYFLEEEPEGNPPDEPQLNNDPVDEHVRVDAPLPQLHFQDPDNPDNPDDPDFADGHSSSSSDGSGDENDRQVANVHNDALNAVVQLMRNLTKGQILILQLTTAVRHKITFENLIDNFKNLNMLFGPQVFPESKTKLWDLILLNKSGIQFHVYCGNRPCGRYIGRRNRIPDFARCRCGHEVPITKARFFVTLDLKTQLQYFLSIPQIWEKLQYRTTRQKVSPTAIEDVMDGSRYRRLMQEGGPLANPNNFSYFFSLDACRIYNKGTLKLLPFYVRINELPPELRQKFHFPVAVFCDHYEPNYQTFLKPIVKQLHRLATHGINWTPNRVNEINSKFVCLGFNVDSPVRCAILNMAKWDSLQYGCTYCTHRGIRVGGSQRYPEVNLEGIPPFRDRNHEEMIDSMIRLQENPHVDALQGHKGPSALMLLEHLDLRDGQAHDDLHQDHEGCTADLTELLLTVVEARVEEDMPLARLCRAIDNKLVLIKTPSGISRKPRSITKRGSYSGTEWRNWLSFYAVPCLLGLIKPRYLDILASLSHACYLLSQDVVEPEDLVTAERFLERVYHSFERIFGVGRLKYNLHLTCKHKVASVRCLGNPCMYSTYNFESLHRKMTGRVTSPKGAIMQVITRVMLYMVATASQYDERLPEDVRLRVQEILNPYQLQRLLEVAPHMYLVGRGVERAVTADEAAVLQREGIQICNITEYKSCMIGSNRFKSLVAHNNLIKSDDTFVYTWQNTFCTIISICAFMNNGVRRCGMFVSEHDVNQVLPLVRHISILRNEDADLLHFISLHQVRSPALKMYVVDVVYATSVPNCYEID